MHGRRTPYFVVSLDFELMWGIRDKRGARAYRANILGVREAIPAILALFRKYELPATWAAVGLLLFDDKKDLLNYLPSLRPTYADANLSPYANGYIDAIGENEKADPCHYGLSLARQIVECDKMELGSHTFSHYYCLERGQNEAQWRSDLEASVAATERIAPRPVSLVFPRNQGNAAYLSACAERGFRAYRGNEVSHLYRETSDDEQSWFRRGCRLMDSYVNLTGHHGAFPHVSGNMVDVPASRFLRPYSRRFRVIEPLRVRRIKRAMSAAARLGEAFHLWWHPHNFGVNLAANLQVLEDVLRHAARLRESHNMRPMTMGQVASETRRGSA